MNMKDLSDGELILVYHLTNASNDDFLKLIEDGVDKGRTLGIFSNISYKLWNEAEEECNRRGINVLTCTTKRVITA